MKRIVLLLVTLALGACVTAERLGIPEEQWDSYSPEEQAKIKSGYEEVKKHKAVAEKIVPDGSIVQLKVSDGKIGIPPFDASYDYTPFNVEVASGDCKTVKVKQAQGEKTVAVQICYYNKTVYLDPSRYDPNKAVGSIQLHCSPIWDRGFTYQHVSSTGYARLANVNVAVRRYQNNEQVDSEN